MSEDGKSDYDTVTVHKVYDNGVVVLQADLSMSETARVFSGLEQMAQVFTDVIMALDDAHREQFFKVVIDRYAEALDKVEGGQE